VLFHNNPDVYSQAISSFLSGCDGMICIVDNSGSPLINELFDHPRVVYKFSGSNVGFGAGHNLALKQLSYNSQFHLFLNPDVLFTSEVLPGLLEVFRCDLNAGAVMPRVVYFSGVDQRLSKLLPSPLDLIFRRFIPLKSFQAWINKRYELWGLNMDSITQIPSLSGCFLLCRTPILQALGGFDERYFMYLEDVDLVRRIGDSSKTLFVPFYKVTHKYEKGSYSSRVLLAHHMLSAIKYFNKWGWFFDPARRRRNNQVLELLRPSSKKKFRYF
jgi:GT2 family glycosyltransferase